MLDSVSDFTILLLNIVGALLLAWVAYSAFNDNDNFPFQ